MPSSPAPEEAIRLLARIAEMHSDQAPDSLVLWCDNAQQPETILTLGHARAIAAWNRRAVGEREQQLKDVLDRLCGEVGACWGMSEQALRQELGNTNYAIVAAIVREARAALAGQTGGARCLATTPIIGSRMCC